MSRSEELAVEELLRETAAAHHEAFLATDGADPEWPLWYATYLAERLPAVSSFMGTRSDLVYWLVRLDSEYQSSDSAIPWERFCATRIAAL
jgi:NAD(P)H-hydrate epimerase